MNDKVLQEFKNKAIQTLENYCNTGVLFKPTHFQFATNLITVVKLSNDIDSLLSRLFTAYQNLLESTNSKGLFRSIAFLLAEHLNIPRQDLENYLNKRTNEITIKRVFQLLPHEIDPQKYYRSRIVPQDLIERAMVNRNIQMRGEIGLHYEVNIRDGRKLTQ
jgi:hypothetical protein